MKWKPTNVDAKTYILLKWQALFEQSDTILQIKTHSAKPFIDGLLHSCMISP